MPRPVIGVTVSRRGGNLSWRFNRLAIWRAGGRALRLSAGDSVEVSRLDGLVVGGGDDIVPTLYGGEIDPAIRLDPERDALELELLAVARERNLPVLGICRGAQMINVASGGTLHANIHDRFQLNERRRSPLARLTIEIENGTRLRRILGADRTRVNTLHRQAVDRLGTAMRVAARDHDGIIQGIESTGPGFLLGVQWHPEYLLFDGRQRRLFAELVGAARRTTGRKRSPALGSADSGRPT